MSTAASSETLPGLLAAQAAERPTGIAIRVKRLGIWREVDWQTLATVVRETALALDGIGIGPGDRVALFAANDPRWLAADLGIETVRAIPVGMQAVQDADELAANLIAAAARMIVCGDQEQLDNVLAIREQIPAFERLVVFDMKGLHAPEYHEEPIVSFEDFRAAGRARHGAAPGRHAELLAAVTSRRRLDRLLHRRHDGPGRRRAALPAGAGRARPAARGAHRRASGRPRLLAPAARPRDRARGRRRRAARRRLLDQLRRVARRRSRATWRRWRRACSSRRRSSSSGSGPGSSCAPAGRAA